jgi:translation elongation factor EF-1beta
MSALEESVRSISKDGLVWGASKLVPIGYGIKMLQINLVVEDEKISLDELQEEIAEFEDYVQSSDVAAMQSESSGSLSPFFFGLGPRAWGMGLLMRWCGFFVASLIQSFKRGLPFFGRLN